MQVDAVLQGDQQAEHDERTRWQDRQQEALVVAEYRDLPVGGDGAEQQVHVGEQGAGAEQLAQAAQHQQHQGEAHPHDEAVEAGD